MSKSEGYKARYKARGSGRNRAAAGSALKDAALVKYLRDTYGAEDFADDAWQSSIKVKSVQKVLRGWVEDSEYVNRNLRHERGLAPGSMGEKLHKKMQSAFKNHGVTLDRDIIVYRGVSQRRRDSLTEGSTLTNKGYTSTGTSKHVAERFSESGSNSTVPVRIPKGSRVLMVGSYDHEILINAGATFKVGKGGMLTLQP